MADSFPINISLLLQELGLDSLPEEKKKSIAIALENLIDAKIKVFLLEQLNEEEQKHVESLAGDDDAIIMYFEEVKMIDFNQLIIAFAQEAREELMRDVSYIQGQVDAKFSENESS